MWITPDDIDRIPVLLRNAGRSDVRLIVVTDNERILGLGDQGAGGMGIPVGKLSLYTAGAGIHPRLTLPISLDVGTDNEALLADANYQGFRFLGAGAAGIGTARLVSSAMVEAGVSPEAARRAILMLDSRGLVYQGRDHCESDKLAFAADAPTMARLGLPLGQNHDLEAVVEPFAPTVLIGTSGTPGTFTERAIRRLAAVTPRPLVFPMSNPTPNSEATPEDILRWTDGRALVATGSPFPPVRVAGRRVAVGQANNVYVFPGLGLGAIVAHARQVTDRMLLAAAQVLAGLVTPNRLAEGALYPPLSSLRDVSRSIAIAVVREARAAGVGRMMSDVEIEDNVECQMWWPDHIAYRPVTEGASEQ